MSDATATFDISVFFTPDGTAIREPTDEEIRASAAQLIEEKKAKAQADLGAAKDEAAKAKFQRVTRGLAVMKVDDVLGTPEGHDLMVKRWKRSAEKQIAEAQADQAAAAAFLFEDLLDDEPAPAEPEPAPPAPAPEAPKGKAGGNGHSKAAAATLADEGESSQTTARVVAGPPERGPIEMGHPLRSELAGVFPEQVWRSAKWCAAMRFIILTDMHMRQLQGQLRENRPNLTGEAIGLYEERVLLLQRLLDNLERVFRAHGVMTKDQLRGISADDPQKVQMAREARKLPELAGLFNMPKPRSREEVEAEKQELLALAEAEEAKRQRRAAKNRLVDELADRIVTKGGVSNKNSAKKMARRVLENIPEDADLGNLDIQRLLKEAAVDRQARHLQESSGDDRVNPTADAYRKAAGGMSLTELDRGVRRKLGLPEPKREKSPGDAAAEQAKAEASPTTVVDKASEAQDVAPTEVVDSAPVEPETEVVSAEPMADVPVVDSPAPVATATPAEPQAAAPATDTAPVADEPAKGKKIRPPKKGAKK